MRATLSPEELKERAEDREKEIQKILGEEKYAQWQKIAAEEKAKKEAERPLSPESGSDKTRYHTATSRREGINALLQHK